MTGRLGERVRCADDLVVLYHIETRRQTTNGG